MLKLSAITHALAATVGAATFAVLAACSVMSAPAVCTYAPNNPLATLSVSPLHHTPSRSVVYAIYVGSQRPDIGYSGPTTYGTSRPIGRVTAHDIPTALARSVAVEKSVCSAMGS